MRPFDVCSPEQRNGFVFATSLIAGAARWVRLCNPRCSKWVCFCDFHICKILAPIRRRRPFGERHGLIIAPSEDTGPVTTGRCYCLAVVLKQGAAPPLPANCAR